MGMTLYSRSLDGKKLVFSGTLTMKRAEAKEMAETAGAKVTTGIRCVHFFFYHIPTQLNIFVVVQLILWLLALVPKITAR